MRRILIGSNPLVPGVVKSPAPDVGVIGKVVVETGTGLIGLISFTPAS